VAPKLCQLRAGSTCEKLRRVPQNRAGVHLDSHVTTAPRDSFEHSDKVDANG
jgi:hypothetical protein